jgi:putative RNA 2'-phosphotransferase
MNKRLTKISKYLSFVLRHSPESIGMKLEPEGWLNIDDLVKNANARGKSITTEQLHAVIAGSEEKRFALSEDGLRIRAIS